ncbi:MAG TPA: glycosyltransferase family 2 protein [Acidobacteriaceae bacterium]|jgi:rhamnosyltransferase|nr:glycosyltransferase family 2 protein [Acidobacteriaceae bacterium]
MSESAVCAVIITFQPPPPALENLAKVRLQVEGLVVVDNGSSASSLALFRAAMSEMKFTLIENGANLGIAAALNIGVRWAKARGFNHVVLFDQDSTVTPGFMGAMRSTYDGQPRRAQIAIVMPRYRDGEGGEVPKCRFVAPDGAPLEVMTSGSFIPVSVFDSCGGFREEFFIDQVDHEFGFRVREWGFIVVVSEDAFLIHVPGSPREHSFLGVLRFKATHHNAMRRYYMTRNGIVMVRRYWKSHPVWSRSVAKALLMLPIQVVLAERQKWKKLRNILLGTVDALRGRLGYVDLG